MSEIDSTLTTSESSPTQHAMLIVWGHYARCIGLLEGLASVPIWQKIVSYTPQEKLTEFLLGLLAGIEYLTDLSEGAAPLVKDSEVAVAWKLAGLADASGVSRTLTTCDAATEAALQGVLERVTQPFLVRALSDLRERDETWVLDADLTGRPVSSTSSTYPGAAFGYMDGEIRLGYQLAEICLQTRLFGRQWLSARHHPGNTVSADCLLDLVSEAERRLGAHPRRRPELLEQRLVAIATRLAELERLAGQQDQQVADQTLRAARLTDQIQQAEGQVQALQTAPPTAQPTKPYSTVNRLSRQIAGWQGQRARAQAHIAHARQVACDHRVRAQAQAVERARLQDRYDRFCHENAQQANPPRCRVRVDAGFSSGENLTELIELGYDLDTKSGNVALVQALQHQVTPEMTWTRVGHNAEMIAWTNYHLNTCPYPLTVGLERFHTPKGSLHAVLIRYQSDPPTECPDLTAWFHAYNGRQTIEAGNKEEKTTFKVQHLMSRSPTGLRIQAMLTVFAANFVRWADEWIRPRVEHATHRFTAVLASPKRLVRVAANSPAMIERSQGRLVVCFSSFSSFAGVTVCLTGVPGSQLPLLWFGSDHLSSA
jgi:hypothetical protein